MDLIDSETGVARSAYLRTMRWVRRRLDGTALLERWTVYAAEHAGTVRAHLRTLVAVHNVEDLAKLDIPWWTYRAIGIVDDHLARTPSARVFEFGSGASTLWLARRAVSVDSVEHDREWARRTDELLRSNVGQNRIPRLHTPPVPERSDPEIPSSSPTAKGLDFVHYVETIREVGGVFDFIAIDGRAREACLAAALDHLSPYGLILLDDAQRPRYQGALIRAESLGWSVLLTKGLTPCQPFPRQTALLSRLRVQT